jgi:hypothetical protein
MQNVSLTGLNVTRPMRDSGSDAGPEQKRGPCADERHERDERHGDHSRGSAGEPRGGAAMRSIDEAQTLADEATAARVSKASSGDCRRCGKKLDHWESSCLLDLRAGAVRGFVDHRRLSIFQL